MLKAMQIYQKCIFLGFSFFFLLFLVFFWKFIKNIGQKLGSNTPPHKTLFWNNVSLILFFFSIYLSTLSLLRIRLHNCFQITFYKVILVPLPSPRVWRVNSVYSSFFSFLLIFFFLKLIIQQWVDWELNFIICSGLIFIMLSPSHDLGLEFIRLS